MASIATPAADDCYVRFLTVSFACPSGAIQFPDPVEQSVCGFRETMSLFVTMNVSWEWNSSGARHSEIVSPHYRGVSFPSIGSSVPGVDMSAVDPTGRQLQSMSQYVTYGFNYFPEVYQTSGSTLTCEIHIVEQGVCCSIDASVCT